MPDEQDFVQAMQADPNDLCLRLAFADWLEECNDPRAELIRLQHTLTQSIEVPNRRKLETRIRKLVSSGVQPVGPFFTNSIGMKFAWIPAGTFLMGSPPREKERQEDEIQHQVILNRGFYLAIHPITQKVWRKLMGNNPSFYKGKDLPVQQVSCKRCHQFHEKLNKLDGHPYRLPTEAEWEYACRACTTTPFYFGQTITAGQSNYDGSYTYGRGKIGVNREQITPVAQFPSNAWGLYDMHGNNSEWCQDWYAEYTAEVVIDPTGTDRGEFRVVRGGSYLSEPEGIRSASRGRCHPHYYGSGFRSALAFGS